MEKKVVRASSAKNVSLSGSAPKRVRKEGAPTAYVAQLNDVAYGGSLQQAIDPAPMQEIPSLISRIELALNIAHSNREYLVNRLAPVLAERSGEPAKDTAEVEAASPLGRQLQQFLFSIQTLADDIAYAQARLTLE